MATKVLEELRSFEKQQEGRLEGIQSDSLKAVETSKKEIDKKVEGEKLKLEAKKEEGIKQSKEKAKEEAKKVISEYKQKVGQLEKKASKNSGKAVDKIFSILID